MSGQNMNFEINGNNNTNHINANFGLPQPHGTGYRVLTDSKGVVFQPINQPANNPTPHPSNKPVYQPPNQANPYQVPAYSSSSKNR